MHTTAGPKSSGTSRASKNPKEPSRGVDLDVIAVASVASGPSGLVQKVEAVALAGQPMLSTNSAGSALSVHRFSTIAGHEVRPPRQFVHRGRREHPSTRSGRSGRR